MEDSKRKIIGYRNAGDKVNPLHMTDKEFIYYLCYKYDFKITEGWNGVERRYYRPNWTENPAHNIKTRDEALEFLGIEKNKPTQHSLQNLKFLKSLRREEDSLEDLKKTAWFIAIMALLVAITVYLYK